jgi:NADPH2:quinone reductase
MVSFGNSSGPVAPFAPAELAKRHSLYVTRPVLFDFVSTRESLLAAADELFALLKSGVVRINVNQRYALADAAQAQTDLETRKTTGSTVLVP